MKFQVSVLFIFITLTANNIGAQNLQQNNFPVYSDSGSFKQWFQNYYNNEFTTSEDSAKTKKEIDKKVKISGLITVHYLNEFNTNGDTVRDPDGFRVLRARLKAKGNINSYASYELMIDPRSPEQGGLLRDAFIELHLIQNQNIRIGQQKTQFGWENRESITELYTVNRAEISDGASRGENLRDIGIGLLGHIPISNNLRFENAITFTNGTRMGVTGPYDFNTKKALWGRLGLRYKTADLTVHLGGSFGYGGFRYLGDTIDTPTDDIYVDFRRIGTDLQIDHKFFFLAGEFAMGNDKIADTLYEEPIGYQVLLALKTKWDVGPLIRYDAFEDEFKQCTFGIYYGKPTDKFRILTNYIFRGGIKDIPTGHDDRLYIQMQLKF